MDQNYLLGSYSSTQYTAAQQSEFAAIFDAITLRMVDALRAGLSFDSDQMQSAVREHYEFCLRFWKPSRTAYKSLAMSFILPTGYRDTYEAYAEGLGKFVYDGLCHFADNNLTDQ
jgi:hypothetical protein